MWTVDLLLVDHRFTITRIESITTVIIPTINDVNNQALSFHYVLMGKINKYSNDATSSLCKP